MRFYSGVDGLKTGYTENAGYCLTATGEWNGMRIISVVMGEPSQDARTDDTVSLLNYGKGSYKLNTILERGASLGSIDIELGERLKEDVIIESDAVDLINVSDEKPEYTYKINMDRVTAPIKKGDKVGSVDIYFNGEKNMTLDLTVKNDVNKCTFFTELKRVLSVIILGSK